MARTDATQSDAERVVDSLPSQPCVLIVRLLEACNAGCFMCEFARSEDGYRFGPDDARRLATATSGSVRLVRFTGGEPLLHRQLPAIVRHFAAQGIVTSIITNGALLQDRHAELVAAGLGQVVVSLDAPSASAHDRFRQTPGLFDKAVDGLVELRAASPHVRTRVNTVAGPHNVHSLAAMNEFLGALGVDDWSIIPLKSADGPFLYPQPERSLKQYRAFRVSLGARPGPRLIGYSADWMGRTDDEARAYMRGSSPRTPSGPCRVVDLVRYFVPSRGESFPCNCVPHRRAGVELASPWRDDLGGGAAADWLREYGPSMCEGCEPANAALGDGVVDLIGDPFGF